MASTMESRWAALHKPVLSCHIEGKDEHWIYTGHDIARPGGSIVLCHLRCGERIYKDINKSNVRLTCSSCKSRTFIPKMHPDRKTLLGRCDLVKTKFPRTLHRAEWTLDKGGSGGEFKCPVPPTMVATKVQTTPDTVSRSTLTPTALTNPQAPRPPPGPALTSPPLLPCPSLNHYSSALLPRPVVLASSSLKSSSLSSNRSLESGTVSMPPTTMPTASQPTMTPPPRQQTSEVPSRSHTLPSTPTNEGEKGEPPLSSCVASRFPKGHSGQLENIQGNPAPVKKRRVSSELQGIYKRRRQGSFNTGQGRQIDLQGL